MSELGIQGIENPGNDPGISSMPQFTFGGAIPIAASTGRNRQYTAQNTYQIIDNLSWFKGRHTFKFGVDIRRLQVNNDNSPLNVRGQYAFDDRLSGLGLCQLPAGLAVIGGAWHRQAGGVSSQHLLGLLHPGRFQASPARHAELRREVRVSDAVGGEVRPHLYL